MAKKMKTMRFFLIALVVFLGLNLLVAVPQVYAQGSKTISLSFKDKSLPHILNYISKHSDYTIIYSKSVESYPDLMTVSFDEADGLSAVIYLLDKTPFTYSVDGKNIKVFQLTHSKSNKIQIKGTVKDDEDNMGIPFASIQIKGTNQGVATDVDGNFTLPVDNEDAVLIITSTGYTPQTVKCIADKPMEIKLKTAENMLGEVTVIAYGKRKKQEVVGAISSIKAEQLNDLPNSSVENLLQGHMSGVEITNLSGTPGGGGSQINIRGFSSLNQQGVNDGSPLFVIDGVPVQSSTSESTGGINSLAGLDPTTIESVEVLKDAASASLYGSRAGNGVILITTKKGKSGGAEFSVNLSQSVSFLPKTPLQTIGIGERRLFNLLAKKQRIAHYNWLDESIVLPNNYNDTWGWSIIQDGAYDFFWKNGNKVTDFNPTPGIAQDSLNTFYNNQSNWWKYMFRTGKITKLDLHASGGNDNARYLVAGGFYDETGIMLGSSFTRLSFLSNLDLNLTPKLKAFVRTNLAYTDKQAGADKGKVQGLTVDPKTTSSLLPGKGSIAEEIATRELRAIDNKNSNYNIRLNIGLDYELIKGLDFKTSVALDHYFTRSYLFEPDFLSWKKLSRVRGANFAKTMIQAENILTYQFDVKKKHKFEVLAGVTYNKDILAINQGTAEGGPSNLIKYVGDGWPLLREIEGTYEALQSYNTDREEQLLLSALGRVAYNYEQKYLAEFSFRRDGSSVFGSEVRWGIFPSAAIGWAFSKEPFAKDLWWLSFGKLRASWGTSGQKFQEAYLAHGIMKQSNTFLGSLGLVPGILANNKLTWEKSHQYDLGLDIDLLSYRLKVKMDYYYKYSDALLMQTRVPGNYFLATNMWNNASAISNEGVEFEVMGRLIEQKDLIWSMSFNISRNWNKFRKSYGDVDLIDKILGRPIYGIYTYKDEGIVEKEADVPYYYDQLGVKRPLYLGGEGYPLRVGGRKIKDQDSDGKIDIHDLYYAGSSLPAAYGGISSQLKWKNLSFNVLFSYVLNRKMMNMVKNSAFAFQSKFGVVMNDINNLSTWEKPGDKTAFPSLEFSDNGYIGQFDGDIDSNIEDISFIRLKQLAISYTFPKKWFDKFKIKDAKVYLTGENLFLFTNYSGLDPETVNPYTGKDDGSQYPLNRKITLGLTLKF